MTTTSQKAIRLVGLYLNFIVLQHALFELTQTNQAISSLRIQAMGPACQADRVWHACYPALTLLPSYHLAGLFTLLLSLVLFLFLLHPTHPPKALPLGLFAIALLLTGAGFVAPLNLLLLSIFTFVSQRASASPPKVLHFLQRAWPFPLLLLYLWIPLSALLGWLMPQWFLSISAVTFLFFDLLLPSLTLLSAPTAPPQSNLTSN